MHDRPQANDRDVAAEWVDGELVLYDPGTKTAHCLSADAAAVWERSDGSSSLSEIATAAGVELSAVERAVDELQACGLLNEPPMLARGISRRDAAKKMAKVGGAALLAPLVYSVAVPAAQAAGSTGIANGDPAPGCTAGDNAKAPDTECASGECYHRTSTKICVPTGCVVSGGTCLLGLLGTCCDPGQTCSGIAVITCA
jgi:hypothetical protein